MHFNTRLISSRKYYIKSHEVKYYESVIILIVADRLKDSLTLVVCTCMVNKEGGDTFTPSKTAELADLFTKEAMFNSDSNYSKSKFGQCNKPSNPIQWKDKNLAIFKKCNFEQK